MAQHELGKKLGNWVRWGDGDEIGPLNFVTPDKVVAATRLAQAIK